MHTSWRPSRLRSIELGAGSIRELVFGVEDGVVQNMTLIAGMVGASLTNRVIVIAGAINAIAGVLSMSMGTFLSSKAERDVELARIAEGPGADTAIARLRSPYHDALVMAAAYAVGAMVPLLPFTVGFDNRALGLGLAVFLAGLALFGLGIGKAIVSHQRRIRSGVEMLGLASAAGLAGYLLGIAAGRIFGL